jgi:hypothetical protein
MRILSQRQVALILRELGKPPRSVLEALPYVLYDTTVLDRIDGAYCLRSITPPLPGPELYHYVISVDNIPMFSQDSIHNARTLASKLCMVYVFAKDICVLDGERVLYRWARISVDQWIAKGVY